MYPEFIAIYICLAILIALSITTLIILIKHLKSSVGKSAAQTFNAQQFYPSASESTSGVNNVKTSSAGIVFCRNCAAEFDASQSVCPKCGTPR